MPPCSCYHLGMSETLCPPRASLLVRLPLLLLACWLIACTPKFDWREVRAVDAPFSATFPAKPATHTKAINLDGLPVNMTMTAAETGGITFAVGSAPLSDASKVPAALQAMKLALLRNIGNSARRKQTLALEGSAIPVTEIEAIAPAGPGTAGPRLLTARFAAKNGYIYQVLVLGPQKSVSQEVLDTFFTSFKPD
jgi:hypothetical protein